MPPRRRPQALRRQLDFGVHLPHQRRWSDRPERVRRFGRDTVALVEERRRLLRRADLHLLTAVVTRRALDRRGRPPAPGGHTAVGGPSRRGSDDDRGRTTISGSSIRAASGGTRHMASGSRVAPRWSDHAASHSTMPGWRPMPTESATRGLGARSSTRPARSSGWSTMVWLRARRGTALSAGCMSTSSPSHPESSPTWPPENRRRRWPQRRSTTGTHPSRRTPRPPTSRCCTWRVYRGGERGCSHLAGNNGVHGPCEEDEPTTRWSAALKAREPHRPTRPTSPSSWLPNTSVRPAFRRPRSDDRRTEPVAPDGLAIDLMRSCTDADRLS